MSDIARLLEQFEIGSLLRPSPEVPNIVDLSRALARLAGAKNIEPTASSSNLERLIGCPDHLVFVLADGLGMNLVQELPQSALLATNLVTELHTVFPSTTPVVLTAVATGAWPNRHGVTGQWTHLPKIGSAAALLPFASRNGGRSLAKLGVAVEEAFLLPPVIGCFSRATLTLFPANIAHSVTTAYFSGHRQRLGYKTLPQAVDLIVESIRTAEAPTYTYVYAPRIDLEAHRYGTRHPAVKAAMLELDREVARLAAQLAGRGRIVVTGDHGLLDTPPTARHWLRPSVDLFELLRFPPTGDARVMYLHLRDGAEERVRKVFRDRYGERFVVISIAEAEQIELFGPGPIDPETKRRLGDLIVISTGVDAIEYVPGGNIDRVLSVAAHHSGLASEEMRIPLIVI